MKIKMMKSKSIAGCSCAAAVSVLLTCVGAHAQQRAASEFRMYAATIRSHDTGSRDHKATGVADTLGDASRGEVVAENPEPNGTQSGSQNNSAGAFVAPVLTTNQKLKYGLRQAFYSPGAYIGPAFGTLIRRSRELGVESKTGGDEFADYLSDYARTFGTASATELFGAGIYPVLFKQNPKYTTLKERSQGRASRRARFLYAVSRVVVTDGDDGGAQPNYSRLAGNFTGAALANIWERNTPRERDAAGAITEINRRRGTGATFRRFGFTLGFDALGFVLDEFIGFGR